MSQMLDCGAFTKKLRGSEMVKKHFDAKTWGKSIFIEAYSDRPFRSVTPVFFSTSLITRFLAREPLYGYMIFNVIIASDEQLSFLDAMTAIEEVTPIRREWCDRSTWVRILSDRGAEIEEDCRMEVYNHRDKGGLSLVGGYGSEITPTNAHKILAVQHHKVFLTLRGVRSCVDSKDLQPCFRK